MKQGFFACLVGLVFLSACSQKVENETPAIDQDPNPFLRNVWETPYGIPPFSDIKNEHYMPGFELAIEELRSDIAAIAENPEAASFENTLIAMERAGARLNRVILVFANITNTDTNEALQALEGEIWPRLTQEIDNIYLNDAIWRRIDTLYQERESLDLDTQDARLLELMHRDFVRRGAALDPETKEKVKAINSRLSELTTQFAQNLLAENKGFDLVVKDEARLAGLPDTLISAAKKAAKNKDMPDAWVFGLDRSIFEAFMTYSEDRDLREQLFNGYRLRGANNNGKDNGPVAIEIAQLRAQRAELMGYQSHAHYQLETRMAKTPQAAEDFLIQVWRAGLQRAGQELADMQAMIDAQGGEFEIQGWDWWHYAEKVRQDKYAFDDSQLAPYFELSNVRDGAFGVANKLFGINFEPIEGAPLWHPEVQAYNVTAEDGRHLGVFMMDFYARDVKRGGAWMSNFRESSQIDGDIRPIVTNNMNLIKPAEGDPSLMRYDEVETLFHEFGHGLHGLMTQIRYERMSGVSGPRDYTEFPAQIMEHWAGEQKVLENYATHYETGEVIPNELVEKMRNAATFNQGFKTTEFIAAALLDLRWHMLSAEEAAAITDARAFEKEVLESYGLIPQIEPRYRSPYFSHIFAGGYSAGYYAYLWSEILDADGFTAFKEAGDIFDPVLAARLKENVFEAGSIEEADELYRRFRGKDPEIEPLLEIRGFSGKG